MGEDLIVQNLLTTGWYERGLEWDVYKAAMGGDWKKAEEIFEEHPKEITQSTQLNVFGETPLYVAARDGQTKFVKMLMEMISEDAVAFRTTIGDTAFSCAVRHGHTETARTMLKKFPDSGLATSLISDYRFLDRKYRSSIGHSHMVRRLYEVTKNLLDENDQIDLLLTVIDLGLYDIAKEMLSENPGLAIHVNSKGETALYAIAGNIVTETRNKLSKQRIELINELLKQANGRTDLIKGALFRAARAGNIEFLSGALHLYPDLAVELDDNKHTIFHVAVQHRHLDVFDMMQEIDSIRSSVGSMTDKEGNNILHLAAKLPLSGLEVVPGEALQLHREFLWFKEVKKVGILHRYPPYSPLLNSKNKVIEPQYMETKHESCTQLFDKEHEKLRCEGEKWLKKTTEPWMLVATMITAVAFVAGLNALRGHKTRSRLGMPILVENIWFKTFATSNAITVLFSASSVLIFLSILTSSYLMNDFLKSLPFKLLLGTFSLATSILAMMVSCFAAFFGIFVHHELWFPYPVAVVALILVPFAACLHLPRLYLIFRSTLVSFSQFRGNRFFVRQLENEYE
ncbi:Ankyrin repeat family protein [Euphorbia peplus]|nr:Ankyrin repeat family protein [Euphorbia peplus]